MYTQSTDPKLDTLKNFDLLRSLYLGAAISPLCYFTKALSNWGGKFRIPLFRIVDVGHFTSIYARIYELLWQELRSPVMAFDPDLAQVEHDLFWVMAEMAVHRRSAFVPKMTQAVSRWKRLPSIQSCNVPDFLTVTPSRPSKKARLEAPKNMFRAKLTLYDNLLRETVETKPDTAKAYLLLNNLAHYRGARNSCPINMAAPSWLSIAVANFDAVQAAFKTIAAGPVGQPAPPAPPAHNTPQEAPGTPPLSLPPPNSNGDTPAVPPPADVPAEIELSNLIEMPQRRVQHLKKMFSLPTLKSTANNNNDSLMPQKDELAVLTFHLPTETGDDNDKALEEPYNIEEWEVCTSVIQKWPAMVCIIIIFIFYN